MKRTHRLALAAVAIIPLAAIILIAGCESATDYAIDITPPFADLTEGNHRVTLSAKGWADYTWKLSDDKIGFLSSTHGESVIYSAASFPEAPTSTNSVGEPTIQTITVNARNIVSGTGTSGSNTVSHAYNGKVIIRHMPKKK